MSYNNPRIVSDERLYKKVFCYDTSEFDNRFFRQRIVDFLQSHQTKTFNQFMFHAVWERNDNGTTLKYCDFNENSQKVFLNPYFYEWMTRTIEKIESLLVKKTIL